MFTGFDGATIEDVNISPRQNDSTDDPSDDPTDDPTDNGQSDDSSNNDSNDESSAKFTQLNKVLVGIALVNFMVR